MKMLKETYIAVMGQVEGIGVISEMEEDPGG